MKKESIKEYLARGGKIQKIQAETPHETLEVTKPTTLTPQLMSLDWGEHYFAEKRIRKRMSASEKNKSGREKLSPEVAKYLNHT